MIDKKSTENSLDDKTVKEELKNPYFWCILILLTIYLASLDIPIILFLMYLIFFFLPSFLEINNFLALFTEFKPLMALISMPFVIIFCYILHLFFIGLITRVFWRWSEKRLPSKEGIIPRNFSSKTLNYYHIRNFMIKYGKNAFAKGLFPWLSNWFFNFVGTSKIGKGTTLEESIVNDKFIEIGQNCYIGVNSALASHVVEGIFGNISYFKIKVGDNVTMATTNLFAPGCEIRDNSFLLPLACAAKHSMIGKPPLINYYWGIPLRRIFRKKIMKYLKVEPMDLEKNENISGYIDKNLLRKLKPLKEINKTEVVRNLKQDITNSNEANVEMKNINENDLRLDFTTSSALSRVSIKFLILYIPIFWLSGMLDAILFYTFTFYVQNWILIAFFLHVIILLMWLIFIIACVFFTKLFLILINLIHKPSEGVFKAEKGNHDFEFWCLRTELKKIALWLIRNWPLPWMDILAFKWFGIKMTFSSSLYDSWCDSEFIKMGRRVLIGQGVTIMSSMVVGKYLLIKDVIIDDYVVIGAHSTLSPGTKIGKETIVGAISITTFNQSLEPGWIYTGIPVLKLKPNKYAESRREVLMKKDADEEKKYEIEHEINIEEDKKDFL